MFSYTVPSCSRCVACVWSLCLLLASARVVEWKGKSLAVELRLRDPRFAEQALPTDRTGTVPAVSL